MFLNRHFKLSENNVDKIAGQVLQLQGSFSKISDMELLKYKNILKTYKPTSQKFLVEGLAAAREAIYRQTGFYLYKVQLIGGLTLYQNEIAEMATGEGKTLTAVLAIYLATLAYNNVHVVTVNPYLARRDSEIVKPIFELLGLTTSLNYSDLSIKAKKAAYHSDIMYTTGYELGFDCLRDNLAINTSDQVQSIAGFCLIDEADSILLDEASSPLIISGKTKKDYKNDYIKANDFVSSLEIKDVNIDRKYNLVTLTRSGLEKAQKFYETTNIYASGQLKNLHFIKMALTAVFLMKKDVQYIISKNKVLLVDEGTGRVQEDKKFTAGLQQAIEAKEKVEIEDIQSTVATITYQNFFKEYKNLSGMTGTAFTEREEFEKIYNLNVVRIPRHTPLKRIDKPTVLFSDEATKNNAILELVKKIHKMNRPVLIGTVSVRKSEKLSKLFKENNLEHKILNAKNDCEEAKIIEKAGTAGSITIATNMAGRGTDIKIETKSKEAGGLFVIGTELHSSRRIDNQLRGRSGRQGDPGTTQFYISLDDNIIKKFKNPKLENLQKSLMQNKLNGPIKSKHLLNSIIKLQEDVEYSNYLTRQQVAKFDLVVQQERKIAYKWRQEVLGNPLTLKELTEKQIVKVVNMGVSTFCTGNKQKWEKEQLSAYLSKVSGIDFNLNIEFKNTREVKNYILKKLMQQYNYQNQFLGDTELIEQFQRKIMLFVFDDEWNDLVDYMTELRQTVLFKSYGQEDPVVQYRLNGNKKFQNMQTIIAYRVTKLYLCADLKIKEKANES
ncbi:preprotein translocase subunit SecA [Lactiplantibacillus plantarum]|uniref:preprotein translocase subunit SecA n=1 Tax=Lactiplantibacillus plantarum TaxID=1590 RepID=UPI001BA6A4AD|nr:preprotein translocase subunit SecA [Lactiplantibacillus plantarum]MBS0954993.1 preprotein translocase subunit SecA [Lactiplantibacillus plantarum]